MHAKQPCSCHPDNSEWGRNGATKEKVKHKPLPFVLYFNNIICIVSPNRETMQSCARCSFRGSGRRSKNKKTWNFCRQYCEIPGQCLSNYPSTGLIHSRKRWGCTCVRCCKLKGITKPNKGRRERVRMKV